MDDALGVVRLGVSKKQQHTAQGRFDVQRLVPQKNITPLQTRRDVFCGSSERVGLLCFFSAPYPQAA